MHVNNRNININNLYFSEEVVIDVVILLQKEEEEESNQNRKFGKFPRMDNNGFQQGLHNGKFLEGKVKIMRVIGIKICFCILIR